MVIYSWSIKYSNVSVYGVLRNRLVVSYTTSFIQLCLHSPSEYSSCLTHIFGVRRLKWKRRAQVPSFDDWHTHRTVSDPYLVFLSSVTSRKSLRTFNEHND